MKSASLEFHQEELKSLRTGIQAVLGEVWSTEKYVVAATGTIWTFLLGKQADPLAWWIPVLIVSIGILRCWALLWRINQMGEYIFDAEERLRVNDANESLEQLSGWEHFIRKPGQKPVMRASSVAIWMILVFCTVAAAEWRRMGPQSPVGPPILHASIAIAVVYLGHWFIIRKLKYEKPPIFQST